MENNKGQGPSKANIEVYECSFTLYLESVIVDLNFPCDLHIELRSLNRLTTFCKSSRKPFRKK